MAWKAPLFFLAHGALANLDLSFVGRVGPINAADIDACITGASVAAYCVAQPSFSQLPEASQAACVCCDKGNNIASEFRSCASYLRTAQPLSTALYSNNLVLATACSIYSTACRGGAATTPATTTAAPVVTTPPAACTSLQSIILSCSRAMTSFISLPGNSQASCLCYNTMGGSFTTSFDLWAASCGSFYKTANPTDYSLYTPLTTFCAARTPGAVVPSGSGGAGSGFAAPPQTSTANDFTVLNSTPTAASATPSFTGTVTVTTNPSPPAAATSSRTSQAAGRSTVASRSAAQAAVFLAVFLSFIILA